MQSSTRQLQLRTISADFDHKFGYLLEVLVITTVLGILAFLALREVDTLVGRSITAEALTLVSTGKIDIIAYRAEYGQWPANAQIAGNATLGSNEMIGAYMRTLQLIDAGGIDAIVGEENVSEKLANTTIGVRLATSTLDPGAPIVALCGYREPPPGLLSGAVETTTLAAAYLPHACRKR